MVSTAASSKPVEPVKQAQDALVRLVRSIGWENDSIASSSTTTSPGAIFESSAQSLDNAAQLQPLDTSWPLDEGSNALNMKVRRKLSERLKGLGNDFGKFKPGNGKSLPASPRVTFVNLEPPTPTTNDDSAIPQEIVNATSEQHAHCDDMVEGLPEPELHEDLQTSSQSSPSPVDLPEPTSLAKRIEALIDSLPIPSIRSDRKAPVATSPESPATSPDGRPIPPIDASAVKDSTLLSFLSSPAIMNGSTVRGKPSIWSILEALSPPRNSAVSGSSASPQNEETSVVGADRADQDTIFSDNSSVMVYSPLIPTNEDLVELAELVPVSSQEEHIPDPQSPISGTSWSTVWPLSIWYTTPTPGSEGNPSDVPSQPPAGDTVISLRRTSTNSTRRPVRVQTIHAWVPSNTKLSVQAMWWGYRMYLPPPVLAILSDKTLEATKRAAMITTALTWFFNNLPVDALPVALRPAAILLQRLAPFLSYIGTFISWSWGAIKSYDVGYGVILTATWLLPVALIPGTWHQYDFPLSPTQGTSAPLPPTSPLSDTTSLPSITPVTTPTPSTSYLSSPTPGPSSRPLSPEMVSYLSSPSSPRYEYTASPLSSSTPLYPRAFVIIPVPEVQEDPVPVPPTSETVLEEVVLGSPLMTQLLNGPLMSTVPLPDEDEPAPVVPSKSKTKKDGKSRVKTLFTRSSKSRS